MPAATSLFTSRWPGANLHLQQSSPAVDNGSIVDAPAHDAGDRLRDTQPDIGTYER
jgi:hypothetical protein